jgi:hypothetical protein
MLVARCVGAALRPARIANILFAFGRFIEIGWQPSRRLEYIDLKCQPAAPRRIIDNVFERRI